jgi:hypothetical protein
MNISTVICLHAKPHHSAKATRKVNLLKVAYSLAELNMDCCLDLKHVTVQRKMVLFFRNLSLMARLLNKISLHSNRREDDCEV